MTQLLTRLARGEEGQDLIEYALLTSIITVAGILALTAFAGKMGTAYTGWVSGVQAIWEPCPPGGC